jgi:hypothetical protein
VYFLRINGEPSLVLPISKYKILKDLLSIDGYRLVHVFDDMCTHVTFMVGAYF